MMEAGLPGYEATTWYGLVAPSAMPPALVARVNETVNTVLRRPDVRAKLQGYGAEDGGGTPESFGAFIREERDKWAAVIREGKVSV